MIKSKKSDSQAKKLAAIIAKLEQWQQQSTGQDKFRRVNAAKTLLIGLQKELIDEQR